MHNESKQSGAKGIGLFNKRLKLSILKLTSVYTFILAIILLISSTFTYSIFSSRLTNRFERFRFPTEITIINGVPMQNLPPRPQEVREDLINSLIWVNTLLLMLAAILSYFLARITLKPLEEVYDRQRHFLGDASHELRTPLAILHAELENELSGITSHENQRKRAESHLEEVKRMGALVGDLLTLSRLDEHGGQKKMTEVILPEILKQASDRLKALAEKHDISLIFETPKTPDLKIISNADLIQQAVTNLIKNSILYNQKNGTVNLSLDSDLEYAYITVKDTGVGISDADRELIFDRFYRVHKSRSRQSGGSGLGLSIVKSSIESLRGTVELESEVGKGTTVKITLPLK